MIFLIYINNLSDDLVSNAKLFADHTLIFSVVQNMTRSANELNNDTSKISTWGFQWKMNFNPDPIKQAQDVIFSQTIQSTKHPCFIFNHNTFNLTEYQKHLEIVFDSRLDFKEDLEIIFQKVSKALGLLCKLQILLPRKSVITVYKSFIGPHMDYGDIIYDQAYNASFHRKLESLQYMLH